MEGTEWVKIISIMKRPAAAANSVSMKKPAVARTVQSMNRMRTSAAVLIISISMKICVGAPVDVVMIMEMMNRP